MKTGTVEATGAEIGPVLKFARRLAASERPVWLRFVLVPGLTDDPRDIADIARFAASLRVVERVDVLPFHQMGRYKWGDLGLDYQLGQTEPPSAVALDRACSLFREMGLKVY